MVLYSFFFCIAGRYTPFFVLLVLFFVLPAWRGILTLLRVALGLSVASLCSLSVVSRCIA